MASESAQAEGEMSNIATSDQINYKQRLFSHPQYALAPQFSNTFGQAVQLTTGQTPVTIIVPPECFNLSESHLQYTVNLPANTTNFIWRCLQPLAEISHIQFYSGSNMWMVDIDNLQNYLSILLKREQSREDFLSNSSETGIYQSNSVVNVVPALRNSTVLTANTANGAANPSSVNYTEPGYFAVSSAVNTVVSYVVNFPLRLIKNSLFSINKDLYFGQTTYLKLYFGPMSKIAYCSSSAANPSAGTKISYVTDVATAAPSIGPAIGTPGAGINYANNVSPINVTLQLAIQTNQDLRTSLINKVSTEGLSYIIPYVQAYKTSNAGSSQNVSIQLDAGNGRTLEKVYHAVYNSFEDMDCAYDNANCQTVSNAFASTNSKVLQYYTQLNGQRIQQLTLDTTFTGPFTDYMYNRSGIRGSILSNINVYQYNWHHCDDWTGYGAKYDQSSSSNLVSGIPMGVQPLTWSFVGVSMRLLNNSFQHYTWFVFTKKLLISTSAVLVQ